MTKGDKITVSTDGVSGTSPANGKVKRDRCVPINWEDGGDGEAQC